MKEFYFPKEEGGGYDAKTSIIFALREYIQAEKALRAHPDSWKSYHTNNPEYDILVEFSRNATRNLWEVTDIEYDQDGFREFVWNWRYWKVMARRCCWYQKSELSGWQAGDTMKSLEKAEYQFAQACGLLDIYESPNVAIERQFPNLCPCSKPQADTTTTPGGSWWTAVKNWLGITGK